MTTRGPKYSRLDTDETGFDDLQIRYSKLLLESDRHVDRVDNLHKFWDRIVYVFCVTILIICCLVFMDLVPEVSPTIKSSFFPSDSPSRTPSRSRSSSRTNSPSPSPMPSQPIIPVIYDGKVWWDGKYTTFPEPITANFSGPPAPEAEGQRAYMTMITGSGKIDDMHACLALTLMASISKTNPDPSIDRVVVLLVSESDKRFSGIKETSSDFSKITPQVFLGEHLYQAFTNAGVNKWIVWRELRTKGKDGIPGSWKQAFSKLRLWSLVQYEKILFLDADTMVLKNLDHLFDEPEFTTAATWTCTNANSPLKPSGGFWILQPSLKTWGLIQTYIRGRDPCGHKWRFGAMTMTWVLFLGIGEMTTVDPETWQRYDGDPLKRGRCSEKNNYPSRVDQLGQSGELPVNDRWRMLNESYDIPVPICAEPSFYENPEDDRYHYLNGEGKTKFDREDAFSVHFNCGFKPKCVRNNEQEDSVPPCARQMYVLWREILSTYYIPPE